MIRSSDAEHGHTFRTSKLYIVCTSIDVTYPSFETLTFYLFNAPQIVEFSFLLLGWACFNLGANGLAALRCFRFLRTVWYLELLDGRFENYYLRTLQSFLLHNFRVTKRYIELVFTEVFTTNSSGIQFFKAFFVCALTLPQMQRGAGHHLAHYLYDVCVW